MVIDDSPIDDQSPKPELRRNQYSLRTLLIVVTLVSIGFGLIVPIMRNMPIFRRNPQEEIAKAMGGGVFDFRDGVNLTGMWLEVRSGADLGQLKALVELNELFLVSCRDSDLIHICGLPKLKKIRINSYCITDDGVCNLKELNQVDDLWFDDSSFCADQTKNSKIRITDAGIEHLKGLSQLKMLGLSGTQITDSGLEHLKGLTQLRRLWLDDTNVTDAGLEFIKGARELEVITLKGTHVSDAGLEHLQGLMHLKELELNDTRISGPGLRYLKSLPNLSRLDLRGTLVNDGALENLKSLTQVSIINLTNTKISRAAIDELTRAMPKASIVDPSREIIRKR